MFRRTGRKGKPVKILSEGDAEKHGDLQAKAQAFIDEIADQGIQAIILLRRGETEESCANTLNYLSPQEAVEDALTFVRITVESVGGTCDFEQQIVGIDKDGNEIPMDPPDAPEMN